MDFSYAFREFFKVAGKGHMQAKNCMTIMLYDGVWVKDTMKPGIIVEVIGKNCNLVLNCECSACLCVCVQMGKNGMEIILLF